MNVSWREADHENGLGPAEGSPAATTDARVSDIVRTLARGPARAGPFRGAASDLDGHAAAERGEDDEPLAHRQPDRLGQPAPVELELEGVVGRLVALLRLGDRVGLVVDDHELAVLLENEVHDPLDQVRAV